VQALCDARVAPKRSAQTADDAYDEPTEWAPAREGGGTNVNPQTLPDPRRWRRTLAKAVRRPLRSVARYRPTPVVGALLLGAILGGGLTAAAGIGHEDRPAAVQQGTIGGGMDGHQDGRGHLPWMQDHPGP